MNPQFSQPGGSVSKETNKESIARKFGCKKSDVVYAKAGQTLTGYKVIYDKVSQRSYALPSNIASGTTITSLVDGVLVHSGGTVDLGALAVTREEYVTVPGSFTTGQTLAVKNEALVHTTGRYIWKGALPKTVPANSTPESTGGIGDSAWFGIGDKILRTNLANQSTPFGTMLVGHDGQTLYEKIVDIDNYTKNVAIFVTAAPYNVKLGWDIANATHNTTAIQKALDDAPTGATVFVPTGNGAVLINDELIVRKAVTIHGGGMGRFPQVDSEKQYGLLQTNTSKSVFVYTATADGWMYGQWGLLDVHIQDIQLGGISNTARATNAIRTDETVNGGNFHIRDCSWRRVNFKYCNTIMVLAGICYLNYIDACIFSWAAVGIITKTAGAFNFGGGDQTRITNSIFGQLSDTCIAWNVDYSGNPLAPNGGSLLVTGCTLSDGAFGILVHKEAVVVISFNQFEALKFGPGNIGAGIILMNHGTNASSNGTKTILGNVFLDGDDAIIYKNTSSFVGEYTYAALVDSNSFLTTRALHIQSTSGNNKITSRLFKFGVSNSGLDNGRVSAAQLDVNFLGYDERHVPVVKRFSFDATNNKFYIPVDMVVTKARTYLTANASAFSTLSIGDSVLNNRFASFDANTQAVNQWVNWTEAVPSYITNGNTTELLVTTSAGLLGAAGVFEISGYTA